MKALKSVLNTIITIMIVVVFIVSLLVAVMAITSKANDGVASIMGYTIQTIQTDSMKGGSDKYEGGDIQTGDVIIGKINEVKDNSKEYELGDIVTFFGILDGAEEAGPQLICHRIVDMVPDTLGTPRYGTKGDNSGVMDQEKTQFYIYSRDVVADFYTNEYHGLVIHRVGAFLDFIRTQMGFFLVVFLPMIIFFVYELIRVFMNVSDYKKAVADEAKEDAVKAAVAEALAEQKATGDSTDDISPEQMEQFKKFMAMQKAQQEAEKAEPEDTDA